MGVFFLDNFTDANGTPLSAHTSDNPASIVWTQHPVLSPAAPGGIQNNAAYGGATSSYWYANVAIPNDNYSVTVGFKFLSSTSVNVGPFGRMTTSGNGYGVQRGNAGVFLYRFTGGSPTLLGSVAISVQDSTIELRMAGSTIEVYVIEDATGLYAKPDTTYQAGEIACISVTDATYSAGAFCGMQLGNSGPTSRSHIDYITATGGTDLTESVSSAFSLTESATVIPKRVPLVIRNNRIQKLSPGEEIAGFESSPFLEIASVDLDDATYYYYGGRTSLNAWQINRYPKADLSDRRKANEANNGAYTTLAAAWTDRATLVYG